MDGTDSGSCPVAGFDIGDVNHVQWCTVQTKETYLECYLFHINFTMEMDLG